MSKQKILVVEDDRSLVDVLEYNFCQAGYDVSVAMDGQNGHDKAVRLIPDLIVLDVMLPVIDGIDLCRQLRANSDLKGTPIVMLTAKSEESDQLVGFAVGADDYVTKPFSVKVLLERVKALLRRRAAPIDDDLITRQGISIDRHRHIVRYQNKPLPLTKTEFQLLEALIRQPGRAFSRGDLMDAAIGDDSLVLERTIDVHIRALRQKLDSAADCIETVRGVGYRFREE
ncbi:MAG: two-component system phosphate regulon response regulator PhoB [Pirellulaceae bacterium]